MAISNVIGISGSLRAKSYHKGLLRAASDLAPTSIRLRQVSIADLPLYNLDIQELGMPSAVLELAEHVANADGLLIAAPEYNGTISSPLKNAIDWLSRIAPPIFVNKPIAIVSASSGRLGGARAQYDLRKCLTLLGGLVMPRPEIFICSAREVFDADGCLRGTAEIKMLSQHLLAFDQWMKSMARAFGASET
jgi:chromate reductase